MFESLKRKLRLAKLDKRFYVDMHKAYAMEDEGKTVTIKAVYQLIDGTTKECIWECEGYWYEGFCNDHLYATAMEQAEDFVKNYKLPKIKDVEFDDGTASPYSGIVYYDIWID